MNKLWIYLIFIIGFAVLTLLLYGTCLGEPVQTHQEAIRIANQYSGFDKLSSFSDVVIKVQQVVIEEDDTVLYQWIEGRYFWKVSYENVALLTKYRHNTTPFINAFDVFVDVKTGLVPKMSSQWMHGIDPRYKEAKHRYDEKRKRFLISRRKEEKQYTVLKEFPKISFLELFEEEVAHIDSSVKNIEVVYIYYLKNCGEEGEFLVPALCLKVFGCRERHHGGPPAQPNYTPPSPSEFANYEIIYIEDVENFIGQPKMKIVGTGIKLSSE